MVVVVAALPYGEVDSRFQLIFAALIYLLAAGRAACGVISGRFAFSDKALIVPVSGLLVLGMVQLVPLPMLARLNGATGDGSEYITLDQYGTINFLLVLGSLTALGETLLYLTSSRKRLIAVTATVVVIGVGSALFGVSRQLLIGMADSLPLGVVDIAPAQYAQFLNRNHFALLIEMTLGLLLGLLLKARLSTRWKVALWPTIGLCWFAIISANSRGGIMSAAGVIILAVFTHFVTRTSRLESGEKRPTNPLGRLKPIFVVSALIALLFGTLIVSVALIGGETTVGRFERTSREFAAVEGRATRLEIWQSTVRLITAFPLVGSGFGAYGHAITPYDTASGANQVVRQAHNDYLEIAAGGGAAAALLTLLFLGLLIRRVIQRFNNRGRLEKAIGFGAALGILGALVHSFVDFGLQVQINSLVFVLLVVLAVAPVRGRHRRRRFSGDDAEIAK